MSNLRPKPWEVSSGTSAAAASGEANIMDDILSNNNANNNNGADLPPKPDSLAQATDLNDTGLGTGNAGGLGGTTSYGSRYGSMYGNSGLGGYGGYGSTYGGLGGFGSGFGGLGGYGGYGGYGMNGYGMFGGANNPMGQGGLAASTQATFQLIESIIGAVGGFAQMLEATYMATQSSFFTMMSMGEQFGNLKNAFGSIFGIFALIKYLKKLLLKITGLKIFREKITFSTDEFHDFATNSAKNGGNDKNKRQKISLKPLVLFLAAVFGIPYLLNKLVRVLAQQQQLRNQRLMGNNNNGQPLGAINPKDIEFCRALYDFNPEDPNVELELKQGSLYAILTKKDPFGNESKWWKCRSREGKIGYVPYNYLEIIQRSNLQQSVQQKQQQSQSHEQNQDQQPQKQRSQQQQNSSAVVNSGSVSSSKSLHDIKN